MKFTSLLLLLFLACQGYSQGMYSESDIAAQDLLITAKKAVLLGDVDEATDIYKKLLEEYNENAAAYELSRIYVAQEDFDNAQNYAKRAYNSDKKNEWYLIHLTDVLAFGAYHKEAALLLDEYVKIDPGNEYFYLQASYQYLKAEEPKEAIRVLNDLEKNRGVTEQVVQRKFEIFDVMGKEKDALKELQKLHDLYPSEPRFLHNIAGYLRTMGREGEANKIMDKILRIDPDDETALLFVNSSGQNKDANYLRSLVPVMKDERIELDKKVMELIPYLQDFAEEQNEELGQSLIDITLILDEAYPNNAKVKSILGDVYFYKKDWVTAADYYAQSVDTEKSIWSVWSQLFMALNISKDYERMKKYSEEAVDVYPNQALAFYYNSLALLEVGDLSEAQYSASEAKMVSGNNPKILKEVYLLESKIKYAEKNFEEALTLVNKALDIRMEDNARHLEHLGDVHMALNDVNAAKAAWKNAIKAGGNPEILNKKIKGESDYNN